MNTPVHLASPHFRLFIWARCPELEFLGLQCFEGVFELGGGARFLPTLTGTSPHLLSPPGPILDSAAQPIIPQLPKQPVATATGASCRRRIEAGL